MINKSDLDRYGYLVQFLKVLQRAGMTAGLDWAETWADVDLVSSVARQLDPKMRRRTGEELAKLLASESSSDDVRRWIGDRVGIPFGLLEEGVDVLTSLDCLRTLFGMVHAGYEVRAGVVDVP